MNDPRVALATCLELPKLDADEPLLLEALRAHGIRAEPAVWDDRAVDWDAYDLVVIRSTWDYTLRRDEFLAWAQSVPRLLNPPEVLRWNTDKHYLAELPRTVTTEFLTPEEHWEPPRAPEYVVKPTISVGSRDTARYRAGHEDELARDHVTSLQAAGRDVMVQPYLTAVDEHGETALIFFDGSFSHAIRKGQMLRAGHGASQPLYVEEQITAREPAADERAVAEQILDSLRWPREELLYARVDLLPGPDGTPRLVELELTEPSLFFSHADGSADRMARAVRARI